MHIFNAKAKALTLPVLLLFLSQASTVSALPIGFGRTQGNLDYHELTNKHFHLYFDKRTPKEADLTLRALETARPHLEQWLGVTRTRPLPVVMSATTANASFANFITDAIELQTFGQASRDLAWHEYVHSTMYRHLDNWFGPAGSVLHLPWMPAWWLEGLAEALSVSTGSDIQAGFERYHALTGDWPTYERLHSLYNKYNFILRGYATSGAFVAYILRKQATTDLSKLHDDFFRASMPWRWPWAIVPFAPSLPMDVALKQALTQSGEELYKEYKQAATDHWKKNRRGELLSARTGQRSHFNSTYSLQTRGNDVTYIYAQNNTNYEAKITFGEKNIFATGDKIISELPDELASPARVITPRWSLFVRRETQWQGEHHSQLLIQMNNKLSVWTTRAAHIEQLFETANTIAWLEREPELTRLCYAPKPLLEQRKTLRANQIQCPFTAKLHGLDVLGSDNHWQQTRRKRITDRIVLRYSQQTHLGDRHQIITWHGGPDLPGIMNMSHGGQPLAYAHTRDGIWLLVAEAMHRSIRKIDNAGTCQATLALDDTPISMHATENGNLILPLFAGSRQYIVRINPASLPTKTCQHTNGHMSPLIAANRADKALPLHEAMLTASTWQNQDDVKPINLGTAPTLDTLTLPEDTRPMTPAEPTRWRGRVVGAMPWIGADASGYNFGILSVPLMDEMQNESVRLTALYGLQSRFPSTEISFITTRFWPVLSLDVFRYQSWNGTFGIHDYYYDEQGARFSASIYLAPWNTSVGLGIKSSRLHPYLGPLWVPSGDLNEPFIYVDHNTTLGGFSWNLGLNARGAPATINETFAYDVVGASTSLARRFSWIDSVARLSLEASRTRGPRRRPLQEVYRPLRVFVPGDGGGLNNVNIPITGEGELFRATFGETQARTAASLTFPLIEELDTLIRLFYLERLDFTAFFNYGGAWRGQEPAAKDIKAAQGYNIDLQVDVKGLKFNAGAGVGQVLKEDWDSYLTFGFDAIF